MPVGAENPPVARAVKAQGCHVGVAVRIVGRQADHHHLRPGAGEPGWRDSVAAAMVSGLEHIHLRYHISFQPAIDRLRFTVPGQQCPKRSLLHDQANRAVVLLFGARCDLGWWQDA